jgi:hypothetical protein
MPPYKACQYRDKEWKDHLSHNPAYQDLCRWLVLHRDREVNRLVKGKGTISETERSLGKIELLDTLYNELASLIKKQEG